ncbi:hypothetical protein OG599_32150 [Streptomyces sp. NBC_01335]|uniref:hypothetical protein n=1 Tax=Streptomyces sp. NBC_01335 TaxID=2903828 RepID=UPI002E140AAF|nr:hypothetical protein OG599_32150 [Streptomyces sp. NBC_01335]
MTDDQNPREDGSVPTPEDLRAQASAARDELGRTVEQLAGTADATVRAKADELTSQAREKTADATALGQEKAAGAKDRAVEKAEEMRTHALEKAAEARAQARERTPDAVLGTAAQAQQQIGVAVRTLGEKFQEHAPEPVRRGADRVAHAARGKEGLLVAGGVAAVAVVAVARHRRRG